MNGPTIAIIGSAGRVEAAAAIQEWDVIEGESGGAAWSDHLCVRAFLDGYLDALTLFLPAEFANRRFIANPSVQFNPGRTLNNYHGSFSEICGIDSLGEIAEAIKRGARIEVHHGFQRRNLEVANACTHMLAFTFGPEAEPKDFSPEDGGFRDPRQAGLKISKGTAHAWENCWKAQRKRHVNLTWLNRSLVQRQYPRIFQ